MRKCKINNGYIIGSVEVPVFFSYCRAEPDFSLIDNDKVLGHRVVKRVITDFYPSIANWLKTHDCLTTFFYSNSISESGKLLIELGIGFHPSQKNLETTFVLRWT